MKKKKQTNKQRQSRELTFKLCKETKAKWNFRRLSEYELAGNESFLRHRSSEDLERSAIKGMLNTWESILSRHLL